MRSATGTKDDLNELLRRVAVALPVGVLYAAICPPVVVWGVGRGVLGWEMGSLLRECARGWVAQGVWTGLVVWGVWWPAWVLGGVVLGCGVFRLEDQGKGRSSG